MAESGSGEDFVDPDDIEAAPPPEAADHVRNIPV